MLEKIKIPPKNIIIILILGLIFFVSTVFVILKNNEIKNNKIILQAQNNLSEKTEITALALENLILEHVNLSEHLSDNTNIKIFFLDKNNNTQTNTNVSIGFFFKKHINKFYAVSLIDLHQNILYSYNSVEIKKDTLIKAIDYVKNNNNKFITDIYQTKKNKSVFTIFFPVVDKNKVVGILSTTISIEYFIHTFCKTLHNHENFVTFFTKDKKCIKNIKSYEIDRTVIEDFMANKKEFPKHHWKLYNDILDSIVVGKKGCTSLVFPNNNKFIIAYYPVNIGKHIFTLTAYREYVKIFTSTKPYTNYLFFIISSFILFLIIYNFFLMKISKKNLELETESKYHKEIVKKSVKINEQKNKYQLLNKEYVTQNNKLKELRNTLIELNLQLGNNQKKYQNALKLAKLGYWRINIISQKLQVSNEIYNIFGISKDYADNLVHIFYKHVNKGERKKMLRVYKKSLVSKSEFSIVCGITTSEGVLKYIHIKGINKYNKLGKAIQASGTISDITARRVSQLELKKQKNLFETMFNAITDGIIITDTNRKILLANKGMELTFGFTIKELEGRSARVLYADNKQFEKFGEEILNADTTKRNKIYTTEYLNKNGEMFTCDVLVAKLFDEKNRWIGNLGLMRNITERVQMIEDLKNAKNKAQESDRLKSAFLANMSHEIRTPMNGIIGFSDLLGGNELTPQKKEMYINIIQSSSEQLLSIINDIIDISKIEAGQITIEKMYCDISLIMEEFKIITEEQLKTLNKEYPIKFTGKINDSIIFTDPIRLRQILQNLINNAIKFTKTGFVEINILEQSDNKIRFFVKDTGIGISNEYHDLIFSRFRQVEEGSSRKYGGTGLGLAISQALVELLGGEIWIDSMKDKGSTFYFTIER